MKHALIILLILPIFAVSFPAVSEGEHKQKQEPEKVKQKIEKTEDIEIDTVIEMLSFIVTYRQMEEDRKALQDVLEERYGYQRSEDPFAFKSRMMRRFMEKKRMSRQEFRKSVEDLDHAVHELKDLDD